MKRLFWGLEVKAPWPLKYPPGRILDFSHRHLTLAFIGEEDEFKIMNALARLPPPSFKVGFSGKFNRCVFLPAKHPHVVAWQILWWGVMDKLERYRKDLIQWHKSLLIHLDEKKSFLPHVTIARDPHNYKEWGNAFIPLPLITRNVYLFESLGHSQYKPLFTYPIKAPFEEFDHTADLAYLIRGENLGEIFYNAYAALAFKFPALLKVSIEISEFSSLNDIILYLNRIIGKADEREGSPFKAVSHHGTINLDEEGLLTWEMIVDV